MNRRAFVRTLAGASAGLMGGRLIAQQTDRYDMVIKNGEFQLVDSQKNVVTAKKRIVSHLSICRGKRV